MRAFLFRYRYDATTYQTSGDLAVQDDLFDVSASPLPIC